MLHLCMFLQLPLNSVMGHKGNSKNKAALKPSVGKNTPPAVCTSCMLLSNETLLAWAGWKCRFPNPIHIDTCIFIWIDILGFLHKVKFERRKIGNLWLDWQTYSFRSNQFNGAGLDMLNWKWCESESNCSLGVEYQDVSN